MTEAEILEEARRQLREVIQALPVTTVAFTGDYGVYVRACVETLLEQERAATVAYLVKCGLIGAAEGVREGDHRVERGEHRREEEP